MVEKDTEKFSRESFKDKILRELEEGNRANTDGTFENYARESNKELSSTPSRHTWRERADFSDIQRPTPFKLTEELENPEVEEQAKISEDVEFPEKAVSDQVETEASAHEERPDFASVREQMLQASQGQSYSRLRRKTKESDKEVVDEYERPEAQASDAAESLAEETTHRQRSRRAAVKSDAEAEEMQPKSKAKKSKKKVSSGKIIAVIVAVLILAAAGTGFYGYNFIKEGVQPLNTANTTKRAINIPAGASSKQIGDILQREGIIKNGMVFQYYTKFKNFSGFKSGYYNLAPSMNLSDIASLLEQGGTEHPVEPTLGKILIPEGYTLEQIAQAVTVNSADKDEKTPFTKDEFMKTVQDQAFIEKMKEKFPKLLASLPSKDRGVKYQLEGYLFPATYEYTKKTTVESLIETMLSTTNTQLEPLYEQIQANGLTVNETLSLAAIVEKEANSDDDRRNVAQVFFNRKDLGMTMDSNTGIFYAEGKLGKDTSLDQQAAINTQLDSPFNTYLYPGFGPGPIVSPSLSSIKAVLNPTANDYLYFVADVEGKIYFAQTLEEQNINVQKYVNDAIASGN
ncbi:endolytic transglycosylase MltG [Lactococcus petauri]|uniref:endolytic transglycosylase MltG n=1 Tax=Lactococcus petauri TaxID=1940789 RepID=UPI00232CB6E8|nr:endolytic transglycosylase MltG [Lactococcus petauri]MDC0814356.1 endolytic transglycosylase MltG [Lactococcus petauri]MDC0816399.1 endolytic transglycosylase MltG [Lactococcus petauri]MDC0822924.1 endolytic transglycosylase MltG [Lactococcus petauri]MDC0829444.1 endolytic transglycosylase MltG [Lactococcus petauri]